METLRNAEVTFGLEGGSAIRKPAHDKVYARLAEIGDDLAGEQGPALCGEG
jgi:hypothetical protein